MKTRIARVGAWLMGGPPGSIGFSNEVMREIVNLTCLASVLIASSSCILHIWMGLDSYIPHLEFAQMLLEIGFWIYALKTKEYRTAFALQLGVDFFGLCLGMVLGGTVFLTNGFWIALISPLFIWTGLPRLGYGFLAISLIQIFAVFFHLSPALDSIEAMTLLETLLFTGAMSFLAIKVKQWQDKLQIQVTQSVRDVEKLRERKLQNLVQINHELRTPIASIAAATEMLQPLREQGSGLDPAELEKFESEQRFLIKTIRATVHHVMSILNDVLDRERVESGVTEDMKTRFLLRRMASEVVDCFAVPALNSSNTVKLKIEWGICPEWIGPEKIMRQVLMNLIGNALKHAPGSSVVLSIVEVGDKVVFQVADDGPGMSQPQMKNIFKPFVSSAGIRGTTGLGLGICKSLVEDRIGGTLTVQSALGVGTKFVVSVPMEKCVTTSEPLTPVTTEAEDMTGSDTLCLVGKRVLVVDDDPTHASMLKAAFTKAGMDVICASNSQQAIAFVKDNLRFDVAIVDYNLGVESVTDGIGLSSELIRRGVLSVIGYTANHADLVTEAWLAAGGKKVLRKPATNETLLSEIELVLNVPRKALV